MDLELLNNEFQISKNPGLDTLDPMFADIAGMVQACDFSSAAAMAQTIIKEEIYDIRIISYFLYGFFDESGPGAFKDIFHSMEMVFQKNWEAVGPSKNRIKHAKNSLNWFFKQTNKVLESEEKKKGEKWQAWLENTSLDEIQDALEISQNLRQEISDILEQQSSTVVDGLTKITAWLDSFYRLIYREPELEPTEISEPDFKDSPELDNEEESIPAQIESKPEKAPPLKGISDQLNGSESYPLQMLIKKMAAFEELLKENKNAGAALVANDINKLITNFDPQIYFPHLFAKFVLQFAVNVEKLLAFNDCRDTSEWHSMETLYNVDMESFVGLENGFHFKDPDSFHQEEYGQKSNSQNGSDEAYDNEESHDSEEPDHEDNW